MQQKNSSKRLMSLDALRGFDMMWIMGGDLFFKGLAIVCGCPLLQWWAGQMEHAEWNGFQFFDIIFPLFLFIAGIAFPFSSAKQQQQGISATQQHLKIVRRGLTLVLLGLVYNGILAFDFEHLRYASVLARIGIAWMLAAFIFLHTGKISRWLWLAALLVGYWLLIALVAAPDAAAVTIPDALYGKTSADVIAATGNFSLRGNIVGYIDRMLLPGAMWLEIFDPEGILSTLPAVATALLGMLTGVFVKNNNCSGSRKALYMLAAAVVLMALGQCWGIIFPINKNLWSSSFVCFAGGLSLALFALFYYLVDVKNFTRWTFPFRVIGLNSITIYIASMLINISFIAHSLFGGIISVFPAAWATLLAGLFYTATCWLLLYFLYRQKLFLKV
ncbi:DUF5009 domain-containing protein [Bacteroidia bacterium]|nr:DUF5009 domain-containing protein [Bacteroidia bacterium]